MRTSNTAVVALFAVSGDFARGGLPFPPAPSASARRRTCCPRTRGFVHFFPLHVSQQERRAPRVGPGGSKATKRHHGRTCKRIRASSAELHASREPPSASSAPGLPLLDLPSVSAASAPASSPASSNGGGGGRSKRGKYPVIELYRRDLDESSIAIDDGKEEEDEEGEDSVDEEGLRPRAAAAAAAAAGGGSRGEGATAMEYLRSVLRLGSEQLDLMLESFPALADVHPDKLDLHAKLRFLRYTIGGDGATVAVSFPQFFGHPLERHIAPRHAFLVASGRPSGARLLESGCRGLRRMLELPANRFVAEMVPGREMPDYRRFEQAFLRGPFDAARKGDAEALRLLRSHGWDCRETDRRGRTALFWAAGGGSVDACLALVEGKGGLRPQESGGDGSTPLHWAAAGVETRRFGTGGHVNVCRWLLSLGADPGATTTEGNTVVMWAAWAGGLDATRWAVEEAGADLSAENANGCTVAHWASSGGDEAVCRYLHSKGVDFTRQNKGGNDPLNHAVAYGRRDIAAWLLAAEEREGEGERRAPPSSNGGGRAGVATGSGAGDVGQRKRRRRDDPYLLDLARLTGDEKMQAFLLGGKL